MDTDRNLLFAVLALQAGLLDRDRFVQGCALWAASKDAALADLLVQQGWLTAEDRSDLDRLLDRQLRKHGGDAQASLAEAAGPEEQRALASLHDADVDRSLAGLSGAEASDRTAPHEPHGSVAERARAAPSAGRNVLLGEIGRGGMGAVFRGRDSELGRELAVKVLLEEHRGRPEFARRFQEEAQIAGQLQHPGVPPVYELGTSADGQPFFTMKLVKGHTLAALLKQRPDVGAELGRFLSIFEAVCQTVAYAHAHGVIHRDLKPSNVMVGAFGEVQVMDWGLAKVLDRPERQPAESEPATRIQTRRSGSTADGSQTGMVGTPGYVAPEQARGEQADERADVFSLGAVLCELLTGRPPYAGARGEALWHLAQRADLGEALARLDGCGADATLIALTRRCLSAEQDNRPRHAGEVAQAVAAHLASVQERARRAEQERAAAEARAEEARATAAAERRARRLRAGLAAALLLLLLAGGAVAWAVQRQHARATAKQREADVRAGDRMGQAREALRAGWEAHDLGRLNEARALADQAAEIAAGGTEATRAEAARLQKQAEARTADARKNQALLVALIDVTEPRETRTYARGEGGTMVAVALPSADEQFANAFRRWGADPDRAPVGESVERLQSQPGPVVQEMVAGLDEWALERRRKGRPEAEWRRLLDVADRLDRDARRKEVRRLLAGAPLRRTEANGPDWDRGRAELRRLAKVDATTEPVLGLLSLARVLAAFGEVQTAEDLLRRAVAVHRGEVVLLDALGKLLEGQKPPRLAEAIECYRAACAVRPQLGVALSQALTKAKRVGEGEAVVRDLLRRQPDHPEIHNHLGSALLAQKKSDEAVLACRKAIDLRPDYADAYINLGLALYSLKKVDGAVQAFGKAVNLGPDNVSALNNLGAALAEQKKLTEAVQAYRKALEIRPDSGVYYNLGLALDEQKKLAEAESTFRKAIALEPDFVQAHNSLGATLRRQKKLDEAVAAYRRAIQLQPDYAEAHTNLGNALSDQKKLDEAVKAYHKAIEIQPRYALAHYNLGLALSKQAKLGEAVMAFRKAIELRPGDADAHYCLGNALRQLKKMDEAIRAYRKVIHLKHDHVEASNNLGGALLELDRPAEAEKAFRRAIQLSPDYALAYNGLGIALRQQKKLDEAEKAFRKAVLLQPDLAAAHYGLGNALLDLKKPAEAAQAFRRVIDLEPGLAKAHHRLGDALLSQNRPAEAEMAFREALRLKPDHAPAHFCLGVALSAQKRPAEAERAYRRAIQLRPNDAWAHNNLGIALRDLKRPADAEGAFRRALALRPDYPEAHNNLGIVLLDQKRPAEAERAYRRAIRLRPADPEAHNGLGMALHQQKRPAEAVKAFRTAIAHRPGYVLAHLNLGLALHELRQTEEMVEAFRKADHLRPGVPVIRNSLQFAQRLLELDRKLTACLEGKARPVSPREGLALANHCGSYQERPRAALRLCLEAFKDDPKLAADLQAQHRYHAACYAALAASGKGKDAGPLSDEERARWRRQALTWLRADLAAWARLIETGPPQAQPAAQRMLAILQSDGDLAGLRDPAALARLPAEERAACTRLWADVASLIRKANKGG